MKMNTYISPPFGNYIKYNDCIRIRGTYTWKRRPGLIKQCIKTIRPIKGGWINAIGFRNSGLCEIQNIYDNDIYSIAALDNNWRIFINYIRNRPNTPKSIEINIGCPNVNSYSISHDEIGLFVKCVEDCLIKGLSVKLITTAGQNLDYIKTLHELGIRKIHLSNTIPTDKGGLSGYPLKKVNLSIVENVIKLELEDTEIIAGGGIYTPQDVIDYKNVGATSFSLSTIWFTPWKVKPVLKEICKGHI